MTTPKDRSGILNTDGLAVRCILLAMVLTNVIAQIVLMRNGLDNEVRNRYAPDATNAREYVQRAERIYEEGSLTNALADGYRMPGYPLFLAMFYPLFDQPLLAARYTQVILSSLVIVFAYLTLRSIVQVPRFSLVGAAACAVWSPFYYYAPILYAESCSIVVLAAFFVFLARFAGKKRLHDLLLAVVCLVVAIYFKPNHILLSLPLGLFILYVLKSETIRRKVATLALPGAVMVALLVPWSLFVSRANRACIPLSTTQGMNLYVGAGLKFRSDRMPVEEGIHGRVAEAVGLRKVLDVDSLTEKKWTAYELDRYYQRTAIHAWFSKPLETSVYGLAKVLHAFGFSLRDVRDVILLVQCTLSIVLSIMLWKREKYRAWCVMFWGVLAIVSLQSFFFVPPQRFKTVLFDFPALLVILLGLESFLPRSLRGSMKLAAQEMH